MYRITKNAVTLTVLAHPVWVRMQKNGSLGLCQEAEAQGVVVEGTVYRLSDRPELADRERVEVWEISETVWQKEREQVIANLEDALCEHDTASSGRLADLENALCELDAGMTNGGM